MLQTHEIMVFTQKSINHGSLRFDVRNMPIVFFKDIYTQYWIIKIYTSLTTTVTTQEKTSIEQSQVLVDNAVQTEKPNNSLYHNVSINLGEISFLISQLKF